MLSFLWKFFIQKHWNPPKNWESWKQATKNSYLGKHGEFLACCYFRSKKFPILARNYRAPSGGEVDIITFQSSLLIFCEVKTRQSDKFGPPSRAVNFEKRNLIRKGAISWMKKLPHKVNYRFDIIEIILEPNKTPRIHHIPGAFEDSN